LAPNKTPIIFPNPQTLRLCRPLVFRDGINRGAVFLGAYKNGNITNIQTEEKLAKEDLLTWFLSQSVFNCIDPFCGIQPKKAKRKRGHLTPCRNFNESLVSKRPEYKKSSFGGNKLKTMLPALKLNWMLEWVILTAHILTQNFFRD